MRSSFLIIFSIFIFSSFSFTAENSSNQTNSIEKVVILGSGPGGLTAGIFAGRAQLNPLLLEGPRVGGHLVSTTYIENYPGFQSILGYDLIESIREHALSSGCNLAPESAIYVDLSERPFTIITDTDRVIKTRSIIISTGSVPRRLGCLGEDEYWGRGVSSCVTCDGLFYRDKDVIVVGGGDSAMEYASCLAKYVRSITILQDLPSLTASAPMQARIINNPIVKNIYYTTSINQIHGNEEGVTHITVVNLITGSKEEIKTDGIFLAIGHIPDTKIFKDQLELDRFGCITVHDSVKTSVSGVFCAGDVAYPLYKQAICAAGTGCMAALAAERYLLDTKQHHYCFD